jgi:hypothetical protein
VCVFVTFELSALNCLGISKPQPRRVKDNAPYLPIRLSPLIAHTLQSEKEEEKEERVRFQTAEQQAMPAGQ